MEDPASAAVIVALAELMSTMQRSRLLHHHGAPLGGLLIHLAKFGAMRPSDLAHSMHVDQSTVSRHLARLEADGLVQRMPDPQDRRAHLIAATAAGLDQARASMEARVREFEQLIHAWPAADRADFARLLGRFTTDFASSIDQGAQQ